MSELRVSDAALEAASGMDLVEFGLGLIARGLFRINEKDGPREAAEIASTLTSNIRSMWLDFLRNAERSK